LTTIKYALPKAGHVKIEIFNVLGQRVRTLFDGNMMAGYHTVRFDAAGLSSGIYLYRISTDSFTGIRKMVLMK